VQGLSPGKGRRYLHRYRGLTRESTWTMDCAASAASSMTLNLRPSGAEEDYHDAKLE